MFRLQQSGRRRSARRSVGAVRDDGAASDSQQVALPLLGTNVDDGARHVRDPSGLNTRGAANTSSMWHV